MINNCILCLVESRSQANRLVGHLLNAGFAREAISVLVREIPDHPERNKSTRFSPRPATRAGLKLLLGGAFVLLTGAGVLSLPGFGSLIIAGAPMAEALSRSDRGGVAGALADLGIPEPEAGRYERQVKEGKILLSVFAGSSVESAAAGKILQALGATDIVATYKEAPREVPVARRQTTAARPA